MQLRTRGLRELCRLLGYTSQAYYQYCKKSEEQVFEQEVVIQRVLQHRRRQPRLGARKLLTLLAAQGVVIGRDAFLDLLRANGLLVRRRRTRIRTTFSRHRFKIYPDLVRGMDVIRPGQLWVSDITYIRLKEDTAYLSLVTDAYSRKIVGFFMSHDLSTEGCLNALEMAFLSRTTDLPLIHHSDRGTQYCSRAYTDLLKENGVAISMTQNGNPRDNAIAERVNGILKQELLKETYDDLYSACHAVKLAVNTYNKLRPHSSIDMLTPEKAHKGTGPIKRKWRNYYSTKRREVAIAR